MRALTHMTSCTLRFWISISSQNCLLGIFKIYLKVKSLDFGILYYFKKILRWANAIHQHPTHGLAARLIKVQPSSEFQPFLGPNLFTISYHLMGSPKYWLAMPIVAPAMQITTETWNHLRHPSSEFMSLLKITVCICMNVITLFIQGTVALGSLRSFKNTVFTVGHIWSNPSLICHIITTNK